MKKNEKREILNRLLAGVEEIIQGLDLLYQPMGPHVRDELVNSIKKRTSLLRMDLLDDLAPILSIRRLS